MKIRKKGFLSLFFITLFILSGCAGEATESEATAESISEVDTETNKDNEAYTISLEKGLEELEAENFSKALAYFEIALEEMPEDARAAALLSQTEHYIEAESHMNEGAYEKAQVKAEVVHSVENGSDILVERATVLLQEIADMEAEKQAEAAKLEEFKGIFVAFKGEPYKSRFGNIDIITDKMTVFAQEQSGVTYSDITDKFFDGETLTLNVHTAEQAGYGEMDFQWELNIAYDENGYRYLAFEPDYRLYPITVEDMLASGFEPYDPNQELVNELREYDAMVPRSIDYLEGYSAKQIEYARVWLNVMDNPNVSGLHVYIQPAGEAIAPSIDSAVYPEAVTFVSGMYGYEGHVAYSSNGDGTINVYHVPTHWHADPEDWTEISQDILNTELVYLEPMDDQEVARLIERIQLPE